MFTRLMGLLSFLYFSLFGFTTWHYIATHQHNWKNYLAAVICTIMAAIGFWVFFAKEEKSNA